MIGIAANGIAFRRDDGVVTLVCPHSHGGLYEEIEVDKALVEQYRLQTGDVVEGATEPIEEAVPPTPGSSALWDVEDEERDEPAAVRGETIPQWLTVRRAPMQRLLGVTAVNGLPAEQALERPAPRQRSGWERSAPTRRIRIGTSPGDITGRMLDFAAPLGAGHAGYVSGAHGTGLTRALRAIVSGATTNTPDIAVIVLLLRARAEEATDWKRRFPNADVVVCPTSLSGAPVDETLRVADLTLAAAMRQTELGRNVLLAVDSLTGLWGAMLETEAADAQREADMARARHRIREWFQHAGCFDGEMPLGGGKGLGGSLTIVGSVWSQSVDEEAEEEGELHPHLRLMEHLVGDATWRVPLSPSLAARRIFPAIRLAGSRSDHEENLVPTDEYDAWLAARKQLLSLPTLQANLALATCIESTPDNETACEELSREARVESRE